MASLRLDPDVLFSKNLQRFHARMAEETKEMQQVNEHGRGIIQESMGGRYADAKAPVFRVARL